MRVFPAAAFLLALAASGPAQGIPRDKIDAYLAEGDLDMAERAMNHFLAKPGDLSYQDSVYLLKNLGVLYAFKPSKQARADTLFGLLLELDPFASLHNTYASSAILRRFQKIRRDIQRRKGGKTLIPPVAVFDFQGFGFTPEERIDLTDQFIGEMQKIPVFHTLDRPSVTETFRRLHRPPEACLDRECRLDISRRLLAEYMVVGEVARIDSVLTFHITLVNVETGRNSASFRRVYTGSFSEVWARSLPDLALTLQEQEAAWLNLVVQPPNTSLTLDGTPLASSERRFPVNPGKHAVCGSSPGYLSLCKNFEVKKTDAVTYSFVLPRLGGSEIIPAGPVHPQPGDDEGESGEMPPKEPSGMILALTLGAMAALAIALAIFWNTRD